MLKINTHWSSSLLAWQKQYGRNNLPWQCDDPYRIWLSEIMLQQTQVSTVLPYFSRFIARFPSVEALAAADLDQVLHLWAGLGYYRRARFLHQAAQSMAQAGIPQHRAGWEALSGVGRSTAAAICAFAFQQREAILDGNVKRVLCRAFAQDGELQDKRFEAQLWALAEALLPAENEMPRYTQALMDLGALICTPKKPRCEVCPVQNQCLAFQQQRVECFPRPKKALPVQEIHWHWLLMFDAAGRLFLKQRGEGIWGKLYSVPTFDSAEEMENFMQNQSLSASWHVLPAIRHRLTHRLLHITPWLYPEKVSHLDGWEALPAADYALPKPLTSLLHSFAKQKTLPLLQISAEEKSKA